MANQLKRRRLKLWKENPHCSFCGVLTILPEDVSRKTKAPDPDNMATIEHVYSRLNPHRNIKDKEERRRAQKEEFGQRRILSCRKCNLERSEKEQSELSIDEKRQRGGKCPSYLRLYTKEEIGKIRK